MSKLINYRLNPCISFASYSYMKLRILVLADINSIHTQKWVLGLAEDKIDIGIFSFNHSETNWYTHSPYIHCLWQSKTKSGKTLVSKLGYLFYLPLLLVKIFRFKPTLIHSHYASSYGLLGALSFYKNFVVSVWGSDLMDFPKKGIVQKIILKFVFWRAQKICVTSFQLKDELKKYSNKTPLVVPFGVNINKFYASGKAHLPNAFTFGCIKHLEQIYNIDKVIIAFYHLTKKYQEATLKLILVGGGSQYYCLKQLVNELQLENKIEFTGKIEHSNVPYYLNCFDVFINVSERESFGVAVAEAMACKVPVIVSRSDGFRDLVPEKDYAIVTESNKPEDIFTAMEVYYLNSERRETAVNKSYELILKKFNWSDNLKQMEELYFELV